MIFFFFFWRDEIIILLVELLEGLSYGKCPGSKKDSLEHIEKEKVKEGILSCSNNL